MSTHAIPAGVEIGRMLDLLSAYLRKPDINPFTGPWSGITQVTFTPDLTANEQATLDDIFTVLKTGVLWKPTDLTAGIKSDVQTLKSFVTDNNIDAYLGLATPTAAQTAAALKLTIPALRANIRVLAAILRQ